MPCNSCSLPEAIASASAADNVTYPIASLRLENELHQRRLPRWMLFPGAPPTKAVLDNLGAIELPTKAATAKLEQTVKCMTVCAAVPT
jgi:hypothetical protein